MSAPKIDEGPTDAAAGHQGSPQSPSRTTLWLDDLQALAVRFSGYGIGPDIAGLTLTEAWGMFVFLRRIAQGAVDG